MGRRGLGRRLAPPAQHLQAASPHIDRCAGARVYRVEVWMTPRQLAPYLGDVASDYVETPAPWIYSGALFVR